ncbi:hypothetical protein COT94_00040 [Candidatus Falkowbacteria bacterium CG10_big_fil_rev_8_21_14_0_10_37_14]|uniref:SHSP domain-containing protein n=1 Tax=Candidatus Falkowbacteria bacterium CG10_big_fil_rev_8_21_14_0_10_37_14 TaxID=1974561 RepID=A0A2M6WUM5_9BACT|nr:Hsp20/alpha crystallin family protein [Candidatus Falkowbacteria bacterium]PIT96505.1 MAG: hypothetical protein COT94_00040 [Candidatus Falkowbacteria bacterium CG10_big_fil_rev_8_21_14_0_10_37_14]
MSLFKKDLTEASEEKNFSQHLADLDFEEGQLAVDVYEQNNKLIVKSTIAGAKPEDIDITLSGDMLTIKGRREMDSFIDHKDYLYRECYWGRFSRTLILPFEVDENSIDVDLDKGVLTIILSKAKVQKETKIKIK